MRDAWLDLLLGSTCAGCGRPGRAVCPPCADRLPRSAALAWPTPSPPGLAPPMAAGEYAGLLESLVNAHKERGRYALARPLGDVLGHAVREHLALADLGKRWLLVPVPSRRATVRRRGHDPLLRVARRAAEDLRRRGVRAGVATLLRSMRVAADQAGLGAEERGRNLAYSMACRPRAAARLRRGGPVGLVVVDDVLTTGSTAREAQRALEEAGLPVAGIAAIAATRRRISSPGEGGG